MNWIEEAITNYYQWLKNRTGYSTDEATGWSVINTPFLGMFNDSIDIFVKKEGDTILLSDDGETISGLEEMGINISRSPKRKEWVNSILQTYGLKMEHDELSTKATLASFPQAKHNMLSAILGIADLELTGSKSIVSMFQEDVKAFFDDLQLIYSPGFITRGVSGLESTFDFQIAGRTQETIIKTFNSLNMNNLPSFLFGWDDVKPIRETMTGKRLMAVAIVDDTEKTPRDEYITALQAKNAHYFPWSRRDSQESAEFLRGLHN